MRVALVAMETARHRTTAATRRFQRIATTLADRGHDVTVFCARWWDGDEPAWVFDDVRYQAVTDEPSPWRFYAKLPSALARHRPDVVHTLPTPPGQVMAAGFGRLLARAPLLVEWFGDDGLDDDARLTRWAIEEPDVVVTPSEMVRTRVREFGAPDDETALIPESIDLAAIAEVEPAAEVDVAYAHPLDESANIESLLLGLAELRQRDWRARIVGDGPKRADYEQQAADLRIDDRVEFVGACDREERLSIYKGAHAFVQTASREYFPTELLWALASGCVGIVEYQAESSAHELIENYRRGFHVTNPQQLADAIVDAGDYEHLIVDDHWDEYDHNAVVAEYEALYEDCIADYGLF